MVEKPLRPEDTALPLHTDATKNSFVIKGATELNMMELMDLPDKEIDERIKLVI